MVAVDLFDMYDVMGSVTTLANDYAGNTARVNVTSGTKHAAIGASMACMDQQTDAMPDCVKTHAAERRHRKSSRGGAAGCDGA